MWNWSAQRARYAFVDVETTGFSPVKDGVVEVGCQIVECGRVVESFESLIDPGRAIPDYATGVHGITDACVAGKPTLAQVSEHLRAMCEDAVFVAHNARFDLSFLPFLRPLPHVCTWRLAARVVPEAPNHKNQTLRAFFDVRDPLLEGRAAHRALADVIVTRHVFFHCLQRYLHAGEPDEVLALIDFACLPARERAA